jgi:Na+/proline symporter
VLLYETVGGMRAVAWTDAAQSIVMMVGLAALLGWLLGDVGGLGAMTRGILELRPQAAALPEPREQINWASSIVLMGLASIVYPQAIQRIFAARSAAALRRSFALMTFMPLTTTLVVTLIGLAAITRVGELGVVEADRVMPLLLSSWAEQGALQMLAAVVVFMGALAAIMSTADSVLLSLGSMVAGDLLGGSGRDPRTTVLGKRVATGVMLAMAALALVARDVTLWGLIELKMEILIQCVPAFLLALHWRGLRAGPTLAGLVVGTVIAVAGVMLGVKRIEGVHTGIVGLLANAAVAAIGSWLQGRRSGELQGSR